MSINGSVRFSGTYPTENMTLIGLISAGGGLMGTTFETVPDYDYALLVREIEPTRKITVLQVNLRDVISNTADADSIKLHARDKLLLFTATQSRVDPLEPIIAKLMIQEKKASLLK